MVRAFLSASFIAWGYFITGALAAATGSAFLFFGGRPIQRGICSALSGTSDNSRAQKSAEVAQFQISRPVAYTLRDTKQTETINIPQNKRQQQHITSTKYQ
jgi:hypothetical protein